MKRLVPFVVALSIALPLSTVVAEAVTPSCNSSIKNCCPLTGPGHPDFPTIPAPVLNYRIQDSLIFQGALDSLKDRDHAAYLALASVLSSLPADQKDTLEQNLGVDIRSKSITPSLDFTIKLNMNSTLQQFKVQGK